MKTDNVELLSRLHDAGVELVIIGGVAAVLQGSSLVTEDLDVCCPMTEKNLSRLLQVLGHLHPRFRFHPKKPALNQSASELTKFRTLNLETDLGEFDVLSDVTGLGDFSALAAHTETIDVNGRPMRVLDLDSLIQAKTAAGRIKDKLGVMHLEAVKKRRSQS
jgi:hypothetical protein